MQTIRMYLVLLRMEMLARAQYRVDFTIEIVVSVIRHGVTLALLWLIFSQVGALAGWDLYQAAALYGFFALSAAFPNLLGGGLRRLPWMVREGELTGLLVQPVSAYVQLLPQVNLGAAGDVVVAAAVLLAAAGPAGIVWTPLAAAYSVLAVACGAGIIMGLMTAIYAVSFWVPYPTLMTSVEELIQFGRYPSRIYPQWVQTLITWVFPVAFASNYPAALLTGVEPVPLWVAFMAVPAAAVSILLGAWVWRAGIRRYEGTGS